MQKSVTAMVENARRIVKCASKVIALVHIPVGVLLFVFGIIERVHVHPRYFDFTGQMGIGIWCGAWVGNNIICFQILNSENLGPINLPSSAFDGS